MRTILSLPFTAAAEGTRTRPIIIARTRLETMQSFPHSTVGEETHTRAVLIAMLGPGTIRSFLGFLKLQEALTQEAMIVGTGTAGFLCLRDTAGLRMQATVVEGTGIGRALRHLGSTSQATGMAEIGTETLLYPLGTLILLGPETPHGQLPPGTQELWA